jgi:hypothetical protein
VVWKLYRKMVSVAVPSVLAKICADREEPIETEARYILSVAKLLLPGEFIRRFVN